MPEIAEVIAKCKRKRKRMTVVTSDMALDEQERVEDTHRRQRERQAKRLLKAAMPSWRDYPYDVHGSKIGEFILPEVGHLEAGGNYAEPIGNIELPVHMPPVTTTDRTLVTDSDRRANLIGKASFNKTGAIRIDEEGEKLQRLKHGCAATTAPKDLDTLFKNWCAEDFQQGRCWSCGYKKNIN